MLIDNNSHFIRNLKKTSHFQEVEAVRKQMSKLTHMSIWANLLPSQREDIFAANKRLRKLWANLETKIAKQDKEDGGNSK